MIRQDGRHSPPADDSRHICCLCIVPPLSFAIRYGVPAGFRDHFLKIVKNFSTREQLFSHPRQNFKFFGDFVIFSVAVPQETVIGYR